MKNDEIDLEAASKYLDNQLKDQNWLKLEKESLQVCCKEMKPFYDDVQKKANFTVQQCDVKYDVVTDCTDIAAFTVSVIKKSIFFYAN